MQEKAINQEKSPTVSAQLVLARFPDLSAKQLIEIAARMQANLDHSAALHATSLANSDEPEIVFVPGGRRGPR